jgi:hypothetical protein
MPGNPYVYGNAVAPTNFINRRDAIRRVVNRLTSGGQSTAILGEPRTGKTSLLNYLSAPDKLTELYGDAAESMIFSIVDTAMMDDEITAANFWRTTLEPLRERLAAPNPEGPIARQYDLCRENNFGNAMLYELFKISSAEGWLFVVLIDDFHLLLHHSILNTAEFFGGLRGLAQSGRGLALVIASVLPLTTMNTEAQVFKPSGSPYLNFFAEFTLGPFSPRDRDTVLQLAGDRFTAEDREAIAVVAGGHPFLLQAAAAAMWDAYEEGLLTSADRRGFVGHRLYREHRVHFADTWRLWSPAQRKAVSAIALVNTAQLVPSRQFRTTSFVVEMRDWGPELDDMEATGTLVRDARMKGDWRFGPQTLLWWLTDELVRAVRTDAPLDQWLRAQELDGALTREQKEKLGEMMQGAAQVLKQGASTLIEAFAKGVASQMVGGGAHGGG